MNILDEGICWQRIWKTAGTKDLHRLHSQEHRVKTIPCLMQYEYRVSAFDIYFAEALQLLA